MIARPRIRRNERHTTEIGRSWPTTKSRAGLRVVPAALGLEAERLALEGVGVGKGETLKAAIESFLSNKGLSVGVRQRGDEVEGEGKKWRQAEHRPYCSASGVTLLSRRSVK